MRRKGHFFRILLTAVLLLGLLPLNIWAAEGQSAGEATVLFTHDLHSCFPGPDPVHHPRPGAGYPGGHGL